MDQLYTIQEVATKLSLSDKTLRRWEEAGRFCPSRTLGNQRRYTLEDIQILDAIKHGTVNTQKDLLTVGQAAKLCGVSPTTIIRWENDGKIHPFITSGNTYYPRQKLTEKMEELKKIYVEPNAEPTPVPKVPDPEEGHREEDQPLQENLLPKLSNLEVIKANDSNLGSRLNTFDIRYSLFNILMTLILITSYHLIFNQSPSPVSPQTGSVQGVSTVAPDPRLDDLVIKFQEHLQAEMLKNAKPTPITTINLAGTSLLTGTFTLPKNKDQVSLPIEKITPNTPVTATFTSDFSPAKKYWITVDQGSFTLHTDFPVGADASFNYSFLAPDSTPSATSTPKLTNPQVKL